MQVELRQAGSQRLLHRLSVESLAEVPHPGRWFVSDEGSFLVMQRSHRYQLRNGSYELATVSLLVKAETQPADAHWWNGRWVIGDPSCRFNARTPLLRCAVLPEGPCERCSHHDPVTP
ncbi:MAG: hypothetical protein RLZZ624_399 [Cyanobacteriota bacterium]|jgi:hypothetical protein